MSMKYRVLGTNDDASDCCCCGRQGLKRVVWLQPLNEDGEECGEPVHFGRVCGARAAGWGYGSDAGRIERRIRAEELASRKHYGAQVSSMIGALVKSGVVVATRVACGFDWRSASHTYGHIYTLPNDPISAMSDPVKQTAAIGEAKSRLRAAYPMFRAMDENLNASQLRELASAHEVLI
jgi:hypothetical protein